MRKKKGGSLKSREVKAFLVYVPYNYHQALKIRAAQRGITMSELTRQILKKELGISS